MPTIDGGRIAFSRVYDDGEQPVVYTKRLVAPREQTSTRLPGVPARQEVSGGSSSATAERRVAELELVDGRLGQIATFAVEGARTNQVRLVDLDARSSRVAAEMGSGEGGETYLGLSWVNAKLAWYRTCNTGCLEEEDLGAFRYEPGEAYETAAGPDYLVGWATTARGTTWQLRGGPGGDDCGDFDGPAPCTLVRTGEPAWKRIAADRVR